MSKNIRITRRRERKGKGSKGEIEEEENEENLKAVGEEYLKILACGKKL